YTYYHEEPHSFPTRRSSDLRTSPNTKTRWTRACATRRSDQSPGRKVKPSLRGRLFSLPPDRGAAPDPGVFGPERSGHSGSGHERSEEHTSELQSRFDLVCRL